MKKIFWLLVFICLFSFPLTKPVYADDLCDISAPDITNGEKATITLTNKTNQTETYVVTINPPGGIGGLTGVERVCDVTVPAHSTRTMISPKGIIEVGSISLAAYQQTASLFCDDGREGVLRCSGSFTSKRGDLATECKVTATPIHPGEATTVTVRNTSGEQSRIYVLVSGPGPILGAFGTWRFPGVGFKTLNPGETYSFQHTISPEGSGPWTGKVEVLAVVGHHEERVCTTTFLIATDLEEAKKILEGFKPDECYVSGTEWTDERGWHPGTKGIQTALGCIPTEVTPLVSWLFKYGISIAGGIAFLMIIFSAFQMITSSGDPEKLQKAKQMLGSAIAGLIFIIFAVFLLRIIGVEILGIF